MVYSLLGLPQCLSGKESACNAGVAGDAGLIPGLGRSPGEGHGNPLQYSFLENSMDRETWRAMVRGVTKSWTQVSNELTHMPAIYSLFPGAWVSVIHVLFPSILFELKTCLLMLGLICTRFIQCGT